MAKVTIERVGPTSVYSGTLVQLYTLYRGDKAFAVRISMYKSRVSKDSPVSLSLCVLNGVKWCSLHSVDYDWPAIPADPSGLPEWMAMEEVARSLAKTDGWGVPEDASEDASEELEK